MPFYLKRFSRIAVGGLIIISPAIIGHIVHFLDENSHGPYANPLWILLPLTVPWGGFIVVKNLFGLLRDIFKVVVKHEKLD